MAVEPDTKNWTWVLERPCPECGFDASKVERGRLGDLVRVNAAEWPDLLAATDARTRPTESQWSALEYGCHVRDVFALFDQRLQLMLDTEDPSFANWDQDVTAVEQRYDLQDPSIVATELIAAAESMALTWERVGDDQWERRGFRSDGSVFTVDSFARYFLHDPVHHLADVGNGNVLLRSV